MLDGESTSFKLTREEVFEGLRKLSAPVPPATPAAPPAPRTKQPPGPAKTYRVTFQPKKDLLLDGTNPIGLWADLLTLGNGQVIAHTRQIPPLADLDPEMCYVGWDAILTTDRDEQTIREVFLFVEDRGELRIEVVDDGTSDPDDYKKLGQILIERGDLTHAQLEEALHAQPRLGQVLTRQGLRLLGCRGRGLG